MHCFFQIRSSSLGDWLLNLVVRVQWEACLDSYMQEAKWIATGYLPSFEEYYENGIVSSAHRVSALQPILTLDIPFPHHILKEVDFPSKLNDLACVMLRLWGDKTTSHKSRNYLYLGYSFKIYILRRFFFPYLFPWYLWAFIIEFILKSFTIM